MTTNHGQPHLPTQQQYAPGGHLPPYVGGPDQPRPRLGHVRRGEVPYLPRPRNLLAGWALAVTLASPLVCSLLGGALGYVAGLDTGYVVAVLMIGAQVTALSLGVRGQKLSRTIGVGHTMSTWAVGLSIAQIALSVLGVLLTLSLAVA